MPQTVLLTGATGSIGPRLIEFLRQAGFGVSVLSRTPRSLPNATVYTWDIPAGKIDPKAIQTADHIIHLAGAGIADERWTADRKREILDSRTHSTELIAKTLREIDHRVQTFVCSSAIGYYGGDTGTRPMTETSAPGTDFLATVTKAWEASADQVAALGIRTVKLRTGVVLTMAGGALPKLVQPIRLNAGAPIASGQQYISWIHLDDLCRMYVQAIQNPVWQGVYNAVAPHPATNEYLTRQIAEVLDKTILLPSIPAFVIRLMFGELAITVLGGSLVVNKRIQDETDFEYLYPSVKKTLVNLLT
jgi:uncharacterized protein